MHRWRFEIRDNAPRQPWEVRNMSDVSAVPSSRPFSTIFAAVQVLFLWLHEKLENKKQRVITEKVWKSSMIGSIKIHPGTLQHHPWPESKYILGQQYELANYPPVALTCPQMCLGREVLHLIGSAGHQLSLHVGCPPLIPGHIPIIVGSSPEETPLVKKILQNFHWKSFFPVGTCCLDRKLRSSTSCVFVLRHTVRARPSNVQALRGRRHSAMAVVRCGMRNRDADSSDPKVMDID